MKALVMEDYRSFSYREIPTPRPKADEVLVRVKACAVCGSDVHGIDGSSGRRRPPVIMGHEAAGIIEDVGSEVSAYHPGDRVTFDSTVYCGKCKMCLSGNVNLCKDRRVLGVSCDDYRMDGAFAEYVSVPERVLYRLPDNLTYVQGAMVEPLSIAYHAATRTQIEAGNSALVVGVGTIGLLTLQVVRALGAHPIIAADIDPIRLAIAHEHGATVTVDNSRDDALVHILDATADRAGVDISFDATGISETVNLCAKATALNGRVVWIGNLARKVEFPLQWAVTRQQSFFGSCASAGEYDKCLELISRGLVDVDLMISKIIPLAEGGEWINRLYDREAGLYKIVLTP
jgi:L-iditol 2-dehydrogenase